MLSTYRSGGSVTYRSGRDARNPWLVPAVLALFGLVFGIFGTVLVGLSQKDYSAYTEHVTATISAVHHTSTGTGTHRSSSQSYEVDFTADGQSFAHRSLNGVTTGSLHVGDSVDLVFPPGEPGKAVTVSTTSKTTAHVLLLVGIGLLVLAIGALVGLVIVLVRRRGRSQGPVPAWPTRTVSGGGS